MDAAPSVIMKPQVGDDAGAPAPRYESDASNRMVVATPSGSSTLTSGTT